MMTYSAKVNSLFLAAPPTNQDLLDYTRGS